MLWEDRVNGCGPLYDVAMYSRVCAMVLMTGAFCGAQSPNPQTADHTPNLQTGYCPQTRQLEAEPSQQFYLDGTIGQRAVRMFLDRGGHGVVGLFYYSDGDWTPTVLGGDWGDDGVIDMTDRTETHAATGSLEGRLVGGHFTGRWRSLGKGTIESARLTMVPKPDCSGRGPWKRFDDRGWPISFEYPASWMLHVSRDNITLICPNPQEIAYGGEIEIHEGEGSPDGPTPLFQCGKGWKFGSDCGCEHENGLDCQPAKVRRQSDKVILDVSDREWRVYCRDGGYVAVGDGVDRVVLLHDSWFEISGQAGPSAIIDRLTRTLRLRSTSSSK